MKSHLARCAFLFALVGTAVVAFSAEENPAPTTPAQQPTPATHREAALILIDLLRQTQECLATCTDVRSVQSATPQLRELGQKVRDFKAMQDRLPEPTTQDYMAAQDLTGDFNTVWNAIRDHIERLIKAQLVTQELADLLGIQAPPHS